MRYLIATMLWAVVGWAPAVAQPLYSNFGGYGSDAIGLSTGAMSLSGVAAPAGTTWSELSTRLSEPGVANGVAGFGAQLTAGFRVADDFTVPPGQAWQIASIDLFCYQVGSSTTSPIAGLNLRIWNGVPAAPGSSVVFGDATTNRLTGTSFVSIHRILNTMIPPVGSASTNRPVMKASAGNLGITLGPGSYWLDWQFQGSAQFSGPWQPTLTIPGSGGLPGWNGMQFISAWQTAFDRGPSPALSGQPLPQDFPFMINGVPGPSAGAVLGAAGLFFARRKQRSSRKHE